MVHEASARPSLDERAADGGRRASPLIDVSTRSRAKAASVDVRLAVEADLPFVQRMLYEAANTPGEGWPPFADSMQEPRNRRFWFGLTTRPGDLGVIADSSEAPIGAAWIRRMGKGQRLPFDDPEVPVLAIGVEREHRGRGVGALLLGSLLSRARQARIGAIDLTVGSFNEAAVKLYHAYGFTDVGNFGDALRMRALLD